MDIDSLVDVLTCGEASPAKAYVLLSSDAVRQRDDAGKNAVPCAYNVARDLIQSVAFVVVWSLEFQRK